MHVEDFRLYCLSKPGVTECFPFDEKTLVFKVMNKMFALSGLEREPFQVNLKCDPDLAIELREQYHEVLEGWHMSKKHWNTVLFDEGLPNRLLIEWIDHSYDLVVKSLKKADREVLKNLY